LQTFIVILGAAATMALLAVATFHVLWAFGIARTSNSVPTVDGKPLFRPSKMVTLAVAAALITAAVITVGCIGMRLPGLPRIFYKVGMWLLSAVFLARTVGDFRYFGLFKSVRESAFAKMDSRLYTPLCATLSVIFVALSLTTRD
jgi:hypothetical protein